MAGGINIIKDAGVPKAEGLYNIYAIQDKVEDGISLRDNLFQISLDKALDSLNRVSQQEMQADVLIQEYVEGRVPLEEVIIQMEKSTVAISLAMTVINSVVQTTKEILQMAV